MDTTCIQEGFVTDGVNEPAVAYGNEGDDNFYVNRNLGSLMLYGGPGDDTFKIRTLALCGQKDSDDIKNRTTKVFGEAGNNLIMYAVNAPVDIDGGTGFNTLVVIGTQNSDFFVITKSAVYGAGLFVTFRNVQGIAIDALAGDDVIFVDSTDKTQATTVYGGLGSDTGM